MVSVADVEDDMSALSCILCRVSKITTLKIGFLSKWILESEFLVASSIRMSMIFAVPSHTSVSLLLCSVRKISNSF